MPDTTLASNYKTAQELLEIISQECISKNGSPPLEPNRYLFNEKINVNPRWLYLDKRSPAEFMALAAEEKMICILLTPTISSLSNLQCEEFNVKAYPNINSNLINNINVILTVAKLEEVDKIADAIRQNKSDDYFLNIHCIKLDNANLKNANLANIDLQSACLASADSTGANFQNAAFVDARLMGAKFIKANLTGANLTEANLTGANLTKANLQGARFYKATLREAIFECAELLNADLSNADLFDSNFKGANLSGVNFTNARLRAVNFTGAKLQNVQIKSALMFSAIFDEADLKLVDLSGANLQRASLKSTDLSGANLQGANLQSTDLSGANLQGAYLKSADFKDVKLEGCNIRLATNIKSLFLTASQEAFENLLFFEKDDFKSAENLTSVLTQYEKSSGNIFKDMSDEQKSNVILSICKSLIRQVEQLDKDDASKQTLFKAALDSQFFVQANEYGQHTSLRGIFKSRGPTINRLLQTAIHGPAEKPCQGIELNKQDMGRGNDGYSSKS